MIDQDILDKVSTAVVDRWNDRELISPETIEETTFWYIEHLKSEVLNHIYNLDE